MSVLGRLIGDRNDGDAIPTHEFFAVVGEYAEGALTAGQASSILQAEPFNMDGTEVGHVSDWFVAEVDPLNANGKRVKINETHQVLLLARAGVVGYDRVGVKARLGWQYN